MINLTILFLLMLLISACSTPVQETNVDESGDLKSISKNITDLVELPQKKQTDQIQSPNRNQQPISDTNNAYLEQEARLMSGVPNDVIATYQQAVMLMEQQKWSKASALFDQVIAKQASFSGSYVNKALILQELSKQEQGDKKTTRLNTSELLIDKAISVNPLNPYAQNLKGMMLQDKGLFEEAEQRYAKALFIWPSYAQAQLNMAILLELYRGKLLDANTYYSAYLQRNVDDKQVQRWQAALAIKIKRAGLILPVQKGK
jgi:tetratricopeptide (TPR) repeat protein